MLSFLLTIALLVLIGVMLTHVRKKPLQTPTAGIEPPSREAFLALSHADRVEALRIFYARNYAKNCLDNSPFDHDVYEMFYLLKKKYSE